MKKRMILAALVLCLCAVFALPFRAEAAVGGSCGESAAWSYDDATKTLTISGTGAIYDYTSNTSTLPWYSYNWCAEKLVIEEGITRIGNYAFNTMYGLQEISFPSTLTSIGATVFPHCTSLESVVIPDGVTSIGNWAFSECSRLKSITLPQNLQQIGAHAFRYTALTEVTIPASVTEIGGQAFAGCEELMAIHVEEGNTSFKTVDGILYSADEKRLIQVPLGTTGSVTVPDGVTSIGSYAFAGAQVTEVILPDGITALSEGLFDGCEKLTHVTLPKSLTTIGSYAFRGTGITRIVIPENVDTVYSHAFEGCTDLEEIIFLGDEPYESWYYIMDGTPEDLTVYYPADAWGWEDTWEERKTQPFTYEVTGTATCTSAGTQTITSAELDLNEKRRVQALDHELDTWTLVKAPTVGAEGLGSRSCSRCGYAESVSIPALAEENAGSVATNNQNDQNYLVWSKVVNSYLVSNESGYQRVEYTGKYVTIEQYDETYNLLSQKGIAMELPVFGGFYTDGTYNFLVFGQNNPNEDRTVEVIRVVRYDLDWNWMDQASLYGADVYIPFDAGSLRMARNGDYLYIRTCHEGYALYDGRHHQSTLDIMVHIPTMEVYDIEMLEFVSHSFNQFIVFDGNKLVQLDHSDASPRGPLLHVWDKTVDLSGDIAVLECYGENGQNATGASLGGLEVSDAVYLTVGNSIEQDGSVDFYGQRNIYVSETSKDSYETTIHWLTDYADGSDIDVSTPQLVKISDTQFVVLWTENEKTLKYAFVDQNGGLTSEIYTADAALSDCQPIAADGQVVWYVTEDTAPCFYSISVSDPGHVTTTSTETSDTDTPSTDLPGTDLPDTGAPGQNDQDPGYPAGEFTDVVAGEYYYEGVKWAVANGVTNGIGDGTQFQPNGECTRSQVVTFLWRAAGEPEPKSSVNPFTDVDAGSWYGKAVLWAVEQGITSGYGSSDIFNPDGICTRGQVATFLHRYFGMPLPSTLNNPFDDVAFGQFYYTAVLWAVEENITAGYGSANIFNPDGNCTRGQIVTFLYRALA